MPVDCAFQTASERIASLDGHGVYEEQLGEGLIPDSDVGAL